MADAAVVVTEGVESTWYYHLSWADGRNRTALCGASVFATLVPLTAWGHVGHLRERWCSECRRLAYPEEKP